jgi:prepilin-type N-terminal cleavage/methylation domain-containing protein
MRGSGRLTRSRLGFTLVELLVVVLIVLLVSAVTIPAVVDSTRSRQVVSAAQILQSAFVGARDAAIRTVPPAPRGLRFFPDETLTSPATVAPPLAKGAAILAYNRFIQLELAPDYTNGRITIGPRLPSGMVMGTFPTAYPHSAGGVYPYPDSTVGNVSQVLMVEQSPFVGGYVTGATPQQNEPTSWYWNVRIGDKIRPNDSGRYYTVVGPMVVTPGTNNPEMFVNVGLPGTTPPLTRTYYTDATGATVAGSFSPEFLFVVNGQDDDGDGYVDDGFNGFDDSPSPNNSIDEVVPVLPTTVNEWEIETWLGPEASTTLVDPGTVAQSPTPAWVSGANTRYLADRPYAILRRPVVAENARETALPGNVVIDATTSILPSGALRPVGARERSRLPVDPASLTVDVMINATGQVVPTTIYSSPTSLDPSLQFLHFWIADRDQVVATADQTASGVPYLLPMPQGTTSYPNAGDIQKRFLAGERRLLTVFSRSGLINVDAVETFDGTNPSLPFYDAQLGAGGR